MTMFLNHPMPDYIIFHKGREQKLLPSWDAMIANF